MSPAGVAATNSQEAGRTHDSSGTATPEDRAAAPLMPWFRVDDGFSTNKKVLRIPRGRRAAAVGLWTLMGSWCARELTDGCFDSFMVEEIGGTQRQADDLVSAGLWEPTDAGYLFPNWHEYQPTREDTEAKRDAARERMRTLRERSREQRENTARTSQEVPTSRPDPTRPDPVVPTELLRPPTGDVGAHRADRPRWRGSRESAASSPQCLVL